MSLTLETVKCTSCGWYGCVSSLKPFNDHNSTSYVCPDCECPDVEEIKNEAE